MHSSVVELFHFTWSRVTDQDIRDFSPNDPGYPGYVAMWTEIRRSGLIPQRIEFDLSEVISLTGITDPDEWQWPERFLNYRRFTTAVAVALLHQNTYGDLCRAVNCLARDLVMDLDSTSKEHLGLLRDVVASTGFILSSTRIDEQFPFFTFASMILAQKAEDWSGVEQAAAQLIKDEASVRTNEFINHRVVDDRFLLGLTSYEHHHDDWISLAKKLQNPNHDVDVQLVIDALIFEKNG